MAVLDVADLASDQAGLVTTAQAVATGTSAATMARLAREGVLQRLSHGVYKIAGSGYDPHDDLRAAWLLLDPKRTAAERVADEPIGAVVSHRSAAQLHRLGDLDADLFEFTVARRRQTRRKDVRIHVRNVDLPRDSWTLVSGLPVTTVLTTIQDLAAGHLDGGHLAGIVRDAIATAAVDLDQLAEALRPFAHRYGARLGDGTALIRRFLEEAGLPKTTEQAMALARDSDWTDSAIARLAEVSRSNPDLRRQLGLVTDPAVLRTLEMMSRPGVRQNLELAKRAAEALEAWRRASR